MIATYKDLLELLARDGVLHQADAPAHTVRIPTEKDGVAGVQAIRWAGADPVVQFIQSLPVTCPAERRAELAVVVARLNHALSWPGLDLDVDRGSFAYRLVLPLAPRRGVEAAEIRATFRAAVRAAAELLPTLRRVVAGEPDGDAAVADVRSTIEALPQAPPVFPID